MKLCLVVLGLIALPSFAASNPEEFHRAVYALHEQQIAQHQIKTKEEQGRYQGAAAGRYSYVDTRYYDAASGLLLSRVQRDAVMPEYIHIVEVNIYEGGRLVRDFGSVSPPWAPLHPTRTFINLHHYNGQLHSFRQYDFYGEVGYEFCEGALAGKPIRISLDSSDINTTSTATPGYKACFDGMNTDWARYRSPQ